MAVRTIKEVDVKADVEMGLKIKDLATKYELPVSSMRKVLKDLNLKIKSTRHQPFVIEREAELVIPESIQEPSINLSELTLNNN
jgi:hypothetical protein